MSVLTYQPSGVLDLNECCIQRVASSVPAWILRFYVRTTDGYAQTFRVPVNPGGPPMEGGPLGRTWGLRRVGPGQWQVTPSIDFGNWHQTPRIVGVPDTEPWILR